MKITKHVADALKYSYQSAVYSFEQREELVKRYTEYRDDYQTKLDNYEAQMLEDADKVLELRAALIKFGIDPDEDW